MSIKIITPAASEPLSLSDVKTFLRVDSNAEDALITAMIVASRQLCEQYMRRILITTTIEEFFDYLFSFADFLLLNISKEGCLQFTINIKNYTFFFFFKNQ